MKVNFNHFESISTVDYPGKSACVVFFNGCPWRCAHCHNKQTWHEVNIVDIEVIKDKIKSCLPFIKAVVFSGGEPTMQIAPLIELCKFSKSLGLFVGIETNGFSPEDMMSIWVWECVDIFLIDVKYPLRRNNNVYISLILDINKEVRIVDIDKKLTKEIIKTLPKGIQPKILKYRPLA